MSDNLRRYRAIHNALKQAYPAQPQGNVARHLHTLAALISGIVGSKSTQLPTIATKVPDGIKPESRVKRFARWLDNANILEEAYFLPYADLLLSHLALQTLVLVMDGSVVGRGCNALMIHVVYKGRALPLAWRVRQGPKGHFPEDLHIALVELVSGLIPECYVAMANSMGRACNTQCRTQAGRMCAARVATGRRGGTARPFVSTPWGRVSSQEPSLSYRRCCLPGKRMVRLCSFVVGQRGIKSPSIWSRIWLQPRTPVACIANDFGLRRFSRIRRVVASICTNRIFPILNASRAC